MKEVVLIILSAITIASCRDGYPVSKVPSIVHNTISARFPGAIDIDWLKNANEYEAEFELNDVEYTAFVGPNGKLLSYKYDIKATDLPEAMVSVLRTQYKDYKVDKAEKVERNDSTYYQAGLEGKKKKDVHLVFYEDGKPADKINFLR